MINNTLKLQDLLQNDWKIVLKYMIDSDNFKRLTSNVETAYQAETVYPPFNLIFEAFNLCSYQQTRVVIIGQDPYHGFGQAHGLSFSVLHGCTFPPSLKNILKELFNDLGVMRASGDLSDWASQGVLLLNSALTVRAGEPGSHASLGWNEFSKEVLRVLNKKDEPLVFLLWGNFAQQFASMIDDSKHLVIKTAHPSPLSANRGGWFGTKSFSRTNSHLKEHGMDTIRWV
jgi:uracil-DNA glycosylase